MDQDEGEIDVSEKAWGNPVQEPPYPRNTMVYHKPGSDLAHFLYRLCGRAT